MMRYQSMSQDCLPLPNGRRPNLKLIREEGHHQITTATIATAGAGGGQSYSSSKAPSFSAFENRVPRIRPGPEPSAAQDRAFPPASPSPPPHDAAGGAPLQWGHKKRSRGPRAEPGRSAADEPSSAGCRPAKLPRRSAAPPAGGPLCKSLGLRSSAASRDSSAPPNPHRNIDERPNGRRSSPEKMQRTATRGGNGGAAAAELPNPPSTSEAAAERAELPKILLSLSRKEKEEDFFLMKGSKLPQRPKRRLKSVEKTLQFIYPGLWLSDLSRGRYEVREKKCSKKKRRGLKGMESMDSDSY